MPHQPQNPTITASGGTPQDAVVVTVDGTSGSGKSALAKELAKALSFCHLNSGLLYRMVAAEVADKIDNDLEGCLEFLRNATVEYRPDQHVVFGGQDITDLTHSPQTDRMTPTVAKIPAIREIVRGWQHTIVRSWGDSVVEGRDIGTVVFPNAQVKIYLEADIGKRAEWRHLQRKKKGVEEPLEDIRAALQERDRMDIERPESGLRPAPDAHILDASHRTQEEVLEEALRIVRETLGH